MRASKTVLIQSILVACIGIVATWRLLFWILGVPHHAYHFSAGLFESSSLWLYGSCMCGISLIYCAFRLVQRKTRAWYAAIGLLLSLCICVLAGKHAPPVLLGVLAVTILWIGMSRRFYTVRSADVRILYGVFISISLFVTTFLYGTIGLLIIGPHSFHHAYTPIEAGGLILQDMLTIGDSPLMPVTKRAHLFVVTIATLEYAIVVAIVAALFRPFMFILRTTEAERRKAQRLLKIYGSSSEDYFLLWPNDKHYFFSSSEESCIAYGVSRGVAVILRQPFGDPAEYNEVYSSFREFCDINGWIVSAISVDHNHAVWYKSQHARSIIIGSEAVIDLKTFVDDTQRSKHFRYVKNRASRDQLRIERWDHLSGHRLQLLRTISSSWIRAGHHEYGFFMGYFDERYLSQCRITVLYQHDTPIGYINSLPVFQKQHASIDHMRVIPNSSPVAMHFLLYQLALHEAELGSTSLNLGLSPLSTKAQSKQPSRLLIQLRTFSERYYAVRGVEQFKQKFQPNWRNNYLIYYKAADLPRIIAAIAHLSTPHADMIRKRIYGGVVVAIMLWLLLQLAII